MEQRIQQQTALCAVCGAPLARKEMAATIVDLPSVWVSEAASQSGALEVTCSLICARIYATLEESPAALFDPANLPADLLP